MEVKATGSYGAGMTGTWVLTVDENADFLIRAAAFTEDQNGEIVFTTTSVGTLSSNGLSIGQSGRVSFPATGGPDYVIDVSVTSFDGMTDTQLLTDARTDVTAPLVTGDEIVDYRSDPPTRTFVGD